MEPLKNKVKISLAVVIGIIMFSIEYIFGTFSVITFYQFGFFLVLLIIGLISGSVRNGIISGLIVLGAMIPIGVLLWPYAPHLATTEDILTLIIFVMIALLCGPAWAITEGQSGLGGCLAVMMFVALMTVIAPFAYPAGCLVSAVGGLLGEYIWRAIEKRELKPLEQVGLDVPQLQKGTR